MARPRFRHNVEHMHAVTFKISPNCGTQQVEKITLVTRIDYWGLYEDERIAHSPRRVMVNGIQNMHFIWLGLSNSTNATPTWHNPTSKLA